MHKYGKIAESGKHSSMLLVYPEMHIWPEKPEISNFLFVFIAAETSRTFEHFELENQKLN